MDQQIYQEMINRLESISDSATSISVKVSNATITLKGSASSYKIRDNINMMARSIPGVNHVDCRLMVDRKQHGGSTIGHILGLDS